MQLIKHFWKSQHLFLASARRTPDCDKPPHHSLPFRVNYGQGYKPAKMEVHNGDDDRILIIQGMKNNAVIKLVGGKTVSFNL